jgi:hypothetical protein
MGAETMTRKERKAARREYDNSRRQANNIAGPCNACPAWLKTANREQKTREYARKGRVAYCRCDNCGHTWKQLIVEIKTCS